MVLMNLEGCCTLNLNIFIRVAEEGRVGMPNHALLYSLDKFNSFVVELL